MICINCKTIFEYVRSRLMNTVIIQSQILTQEKQFLKGSKETMLFLTT